MGATNAIWRAIAAPTSPGELALMEVKGEGRLTDAKGPEDFEAKHPRQGPEVLVVQVSDAWFFIEKDDKGHLRAGRRFTWKHLTELASRDYRFEY